MAQTAAVEPPQLLEAAEVEYPSGALAERREGRVLMRLTLDAEGRVTGVEVVEPAGHGFDEAAAAAVPRFRFTPAKRDGVPVAARVLYAYDFLLPEPVSESEPPEPTSQVGAAASPQQPIAVFVQGASEAERVRESAAAVHVVETDEARRRTADLGEVLARQQGVGVRRGGGLGSETRFSLNGLTDDQIRFFLDGVPLELSGFPFGIANVPVNLVDRVEIYRGVVPIRFGADALGGAVNVVTDDDIDGTHGAGSYETGSFGMRRISAVARHLDDSTGFFTRVGGFFDDTDNDYEIDVEVPDARGRLSPARVRRFHDDYRAGGGHVEAGFVDRPWAKRLLVRGFVTDYDKELQNNIVMTVPYGEVTYGELSAGASVRYEHLLAKRLRLDALAGYVYSVTDFRDIGECVYNWFGRCGRQRRVPGEIEAKPRDQLQWTHSAFGRINLAYRLHRAHALRLSVAPTHATRTGDERRQADRNARDPLTAQRDLTTIVSGVEHELDVLDDRLENVAFVKSYVQLARSEEPLPGGIFRDADRDTHRFGVGNGLRYRFLDWLYAKASYEWATRLPRTDEMFGDGRLILDNLQLKPEVSHNANLGITLDGLQTPGGALRADLNGFLREADQLIVLLGSDRVLTYQNVFGARSVGVEAAIGWTSPGEYVAIDGNLTYVDLRNTSSEGTFGDFASDRIPNRPYLFSNSSARFQLHDVATENDELSLTWDTRYVHEFFRGWESVGLRESKQTIPPQLLHAVALTYLLTADPLALSFTAEVQNLTDQAAFDFFGVQRPGRAFYFKTTAEL